MKSSEPDVHVLVLDDQVENLMMLHNFLSPYFSLHLARDANTALNYINSGKPLHLIITDAIMPEMDGFEFCLKIKNSEKKIDIPIIFISALDSSSDEDRAFTVGAADFIRKPLNSSVALARIRNQIDIFLSAQKLKKENIELEQRFNERTRELIEKNIELERKNKEISTLQDVSMIALHSISENGTGTSGLHVKRVQSYVRVLCRYLAHIKKFSNELTANNIDLICRSAPLYDIGKLAIPEHILFKPGKLSQDELAIMRTHPLLGKEAILHAEKALGGENSFLRYAREMVCYHREWWNGSGYPYGLRGEEIPLSARVLCLADVYDALTTERCYKPAWTHQQAVNMIRSERATHFDPDVVDAFLVLEQDFIDISQRYQMAAV